MASPTDFRYTHLSKIDPEFAAVREETDKVFNMLFALPLPQLRGMMATAPPALSSDCPTELEIRYRKVKMRDESEIAVKIYRPLDIEMEVGQRRLPLFLAAHGGGKNGVILVAISNAQELGIDANRVIVGGSSAGGNLSASLALRARDQGLSCIIGQVLNTPVTCHPKHFPFAKYEYTSYEQNAEASILSKKTMNWFWDQYLPDAGRATYANPLLADSLYDLPPALVQIAGLDPLRDEGFAYADALKAAGNNVEIQVYAGMPHGFGRFTTFVAGRRYVQSVVEFVAWVLRKSEPRRKGESPEL
ncbi:MAG: hypothetical protein M1827_000429 [Pycnora praestabilis]|nr:MAG: hypothetical protein M1827_000429 [Pycnora praestabilis]